jgi:type IV pilus assembly protein PilW
MSTAMNPLSNKRAGSRQSGFTILEMMVALAIGMIVVLGFAVTFVNMKQTFNSQSGLSQLQDNERLAMSILTAAIEQAGYFPTGANPAAVPPVPPKYIDRSQISASTEPVGGLMASQQYLAGTSAVAPAVESLSAAFASAPGDGLLTCQGGTNPASATATVAIRDTFYVDTTQNALGCSVLANGVTTTVPGSAFQPLVTNVKSMTVLYGIDTDADTFVDTYMTATSVSAIAGWSQVKSIRVTLNFINPNAAATGQATIPWVQIINVMNNK